MLNIGHLPAGRAVSILAGYRTPDPTDWREEGRDMAARKAIPKRLRFEVFKRDSFKCQYCGKGSPEVILQVDHVHPVSKGGDADILNLVTACVDCNAGKSDVALDDDTALARQRRQLEELNERREQLEMMLEWREGMRGIRENAVDAVCAEYARVTPGRCLNDRGVKDVKKLLREFPLDSILDAVQIAGEQYIKLDAAGHATEESASLAFAKLGGICRLRGAEDGERKLYYIRGICRNRFNYYVAWECIALLKRAYALGYSLEFLQDLARQKNSYSAWAREMEEAISQAEASDRAKS